MTDKIIPIRGKEMTVKDALEHASKESAHFKHCLVIMLPEKPSDGVSIFTTDMDMNTMARAHLEVQQIALSALPDYFIEEPPVT